MVIKLEFKSKGLEYEETVKKLSNSGYIPAPKALVGKKVKVIILE